MKVKIGIIGSRKLACIITEWISKQLDVIIVGVVAPPFNGWWNDELIKVAEFLGLPICSSLEELKLREPDIVFSINYWKRIEKDFIDIIPRGIVNIHHSYLLKYKGRYSTSWAIINARKLKRWEHGTTLHYIDEKLDEGKIIASYKCEITEEDTAEILFNRVELLAYKMFTDYFKKIINNQIESFLESDHDSYFYDADSNKNLEIPYGLTIEEVYDFVRAWTFKDRPKPFYLYKGKRIYLTL